MEENVRMTYSQAVAELLKMCKAKLLATDEELKKILNEL